MEIILAILALLAVSGLKLGREIQASKEKETQEKAKAQAEERQQLPAEPFTLEYHFKNRLETDLDQINKALDAYELSGLEFVEDCGYLVTEITLDVATNEQAVGYWYGLDDCVLRCTPAKPGEGFHYQISTMTVEKPAADCAACWREAHPGRIMRTMVQLEFEAVYAVIVLHHEPKAQTKQFIPDPVNAATIRPDSRRGKYPLYQRS